MSKTAHEKRMEKLQNWEIQEMTNRHESKKAWWRCGISLGGSLLLYPLFNLGLGEGLECLIIVLFVICGHVFLFSIMNILGLERERQRRNAELDLLTELDNYDV